MARGIFGILIKLTMNKRACLEESQDFSESTEGPREGESKLECPKCGCCLGYLGESDDSYEPGDEVEDEKNINALWESKLLFPPRKMDLD